MINQTADGGRPALISTIFTKARIYLSVLRKRDRPKVKLTVRQLGPDAADLIVMVEL